LRRPSGLAALTDTFSASMLGRKLGDARVRMVRSHSRGNPAAARLDRTTLSSVGGARKLNSFGGEK